MRTYSTSSSQESELFDFWTATANASANTKGAWTTTNYAHPVSAESLWVSVSGAHSGYTYLLDIGLDDGAGNIHIIAQDLSFGGETLNQTDAGATLIFLPLHVPKNYYPAFRIACTTGSQSLNVHLILNAQGGVGGAPGYARCVPLTTASSSRGVTVDCGASANTNVRTQLVASTAVPVQGLMAMIGPNNDTAITTATRIKFTIDMGASGQEMTFWGGHLLCREVNLDLIRPMYLPFRPYYIPAGSRLSANAQCNITTSGDRAFDLMLYGFQ